MKAGVNRTISSCMRQAFTGIPFVLAVVGLLLAFVSGGFSSLWTAVSSYKEKLLEYGMHFTVFQTACGSEAVHLLLPVFSALPFTASFLDDVDSGFLKSYLPRAGRSHYVAGKLLAVGISGGAVCVAAIGIYYNILRLMLLPMEKCAAAGSAGYGKDVGRVCVLFFCAGLLFSLLGMLFSILTSSKYMAFASPFVLEYVLIILHERYLKKLYMIDPKEWLTPTADVWFMGQFGVFLYMMLLILLVLLILALVMTRRLEEL